MKLPPRFASSRRIGMDTFGASAPFSELCKKFGFTVDAVAKSAKQALGRA